MGNTISHNEALRLSQIRSKSQWSAPANAYQGGTHNIETEIEDGNKKSMNWLKWAGIIAAGTIGTAYLVKSGKGKKAVDYVMNKLQKGVQKLEVTKDINGKVTERKIGDKLLNFVKNDKGKFIAKIDDEPANIKFIYKGVVSTYKDGRLVSAVKRGSNGFAKTYVDGLLSKAKYYDENSKLLSKTMALFDKNGKITKLSTVSANGNIVKDIKFEYDKNDKLANKEEIKSLSNNKIDSEVNVPAEQNTNTNSNGPQESQADVKPTEATQAMVSEKPTAKPELPDLEAQTKPNIHEGEITTPPADVKPTKAPKKAQKSNKPTEK